MSQAFVKEEDSQWLHDIGPSMNSLVVFLTRENNGIRVYEQKMSVDPKCVNEIHHMSNGLSYAKDPEGKWTIVW